MPVISYNRCIVCDSDRFYLFRKRGQFELLRCGQCKLIFCNNIELEKIRKFYLEDYFEKNPAGVGDNLDYYENMGFVFNYNAKAILKQIEKCRKKPGKLLDVGSGFGYFLNEASLRGWKVFGVEASKDGCAYTKEHFGITAVPSLFEYDNTGLERVQFDVITFLGVLDHSSAPHKMLAKAYSLLNANGLVVSVVQNIDWWFKIIDFRPPIHLFWFSERNLSRLYQKLGFRILVIRPFWIPFSVDEFVRKALTHFLRFPQLVPYICPTLSYLFKNTIIKWPDETLIIAQKVDKV